MRSSEGDAHHTSQLTLHSSPFFSWACPSQSLGSRFPLQVRTRRSSLLAGFPLQSLTRTMQPNMANLLIALSVVAALLLSGCESQPTPVTQEPEPFKLPVSTFEISGKTDTTLFGPQGTRVFVPKEAFVFADGTPAQGPVKMEMKELYSTSDIVLSGTSTMSGISPLETGGMVHLQALCEGRELVLKSGVNVIVHFPKERGESLPMDLFYPSQGSSDSAVVDWSIDTTALVKSVLKLGMWGYR